MKHFFFVMFCKIPLSAKNNDFAFYMVRYHIDYCQYQEDNDFI